MKRADQASRAFQRRTCMMVSVNVPPMSSPSRLALKNVLEDSPKLEPVGVFRLVDPRP